MTSTAMLGRDIFLRHTQKDGKQYVQQHRVWDAQRFIGAQQAAAANVNADERDPAQRNARVEQITEEQYRKEHAA